VGVVFCSFWCDVDVDVGADVDAAVAAVHPILYSEVVSLFVGGELHGKETSSRLPPVRDACRSPPLVASLLAFHRCSHPPLREHTGTCTTRTPTSLQGAVFLS
ncbi:unnamed protein product, partial [Scytosiphon promiscuus]